MVQFPGVITDLGVEYQEGADGYLSKSDVRERDVLVKAKVDSTVLRCLAKITFNYLAKTSGDDFVMKDDFTAI